MVKRLIIIGLILAGLVIPTVLYVHAQGGSLAPLPAAAPYQPVGEEQTLAAVYQSVIRSVVNINTVGRGGGGTGSGFVIDTEGHIVTNNHVVEGAEYIRVSFFDGTIADAELIGRDPDSDLAVIKINPTGADIQPVSIADSSTVFVGQSVLAIGSPFGQDFTLTTGIVSALDRSLSRENNFSIPELIQTDAAINPGNSGGPLLDLQGRVIGVNTAILGGTRTASGVGFAVPSNQVRRVVPYLIATGEYKHSFLGISGADLLPEQRQAMNLPANLRGVMVVQVTRGGPAAKAGLQGATGAINTPFGQQALGGDIITAINGTPINSMTDLVGYLNDFTQPGDTITITIVRGSQTGDVQVTLMERPR